eukprot:c28019_g2_i1 orf=152-1495(+)
MGRLLCRRSLYLLLRLSNAQDHLSQLHSVVDAQHSLHANQLQQMRGFSITRGYGDLPHREANKGFLGLGITLRRRDFHATGMNSMPVRDLYEILDVKKGASQDEIKRAYYSLAKKHHPDVNKGDSNAEKRFQEIQNAYEVLKDEEKRALYDQVGPEAFQQASAGGGPAGSGGFGFDFADNIFSGPMADMFRSVFGGGGSRQNLDIHVNLKVSFMEAAKGCTKKVSYFAPTRCEACKGSGVPPGVRPETCKTCGGGGTAFVRQGFTIMGSTCSTCAGSGQTFKEECRSCRGSGTIKRPKEEEVDIPAGVESGMALRHSGKGGAGQRGVRPGDLLVVLEVLPDRIFRREGADIHVDSTLSITQAIFGGTIRVPTLTGDVVLKVRPGTQPNQKLVLRGKGIKILDKGYGDQYVNFRVQIPTNLTQRQRYLMEEFQKEEGESESATATGSG